MIFPFLGLLSVIATPEIVGHLVLLNCGPIPKAGGSKVENFPGPLNAWPVLMLLTEAACSAGRGKYAVWL